MIKLNPDREGTSTSYDDYVEKYATRDATNTKRHMEADWSRKKLEDKKE